MDQTTFADAAVAAYMKENYLSLKIDAEKGEGPALAEKFGVEGFPTFVLADTQGNEIDRIIGYRPTDAFLKTIQDFKAGKTFQAFQREIQKNPNDPALLYALGLKWRERSENDKARDLFQKLLASDKEKKNEKTLLAEREMAMIELEENDNANALIDFVKAHPEPTFALDGHRTLVRVYEQTGNVEAAAKSYEYVQSNSPADAEWMNAYAWFLATNDLKLERAIELATKASEMEPVAYHILDTLAECYFRTKQFEKAVEAQKKAIALIKNAKAKKEYLDRLEKFEEAAAKVKG